MTFDELRLRDEILQVLYWLRGEGLGESATARQVSVLVGFPEDQVSSLFVSMQADGLLIATALGVVELTELGGKEGGQRFGQEFADITNASHGACGPDCEDCLINGPEFCSHHNPDRVRGPAT